MAADQFGSGIGLDHDFDFMVTETGDLAHTTGKSELNKDLSFALARVLDGATGGFIDQGFLTEVEMVAEDVVSRDPRVEEVRSVDVSDISQVEGTDRINIRVNAVTANGLVDFDVSA